jgi:hypothetical protein
LHIYLPDLEAVNRAIANTPMSYNVQFKSRSTVETYQMMAADVFADRLRMEAWTQGMLFPEKRHAIWLPERELGKAQFNVKWIDKELNYEQKVVPSPPHPLPESDMGVFVVEIS